MRVVRLYDQAREPHGWMQIIRPLEFAAFATLADSGAPCDADGTPTSTVDQCCIIFDSLTAADEFCRERVAQTPQVRFDILDAEGHRNPPLITVVHSSRAAALDGTSAKIRRNIHAAIALFAIGPPLIWYDWTFYGGVLVMPTIIGINAPLIAVRLMMMNRSYVAAERARRARVARALDRAAS